ncbi:MAG: competence/damage-inducible protein A [Paracoccaceae bacterium]
MPNPTAAMLVIGDEILSGRTRDANMHHAAGALAARGIDLREVRVVSDDADAIVAAVRALSAAWDHVLTSGGIGPTHDDITADAVAQALGASIDVRADARAVLEAHYAARETELNEARLRMARIPEGAALIDNPVSAAPGFSLGNVHVMAGVPKIFAAMLAGLLPRLAGGAPLLTVSVAVEMGEGDLAGPLREVAQAWPELSVGSYPFQRPDGRYGAQIVLRGDDAAALEAAEARLREVFAGALRD